MVQMYQMLFVIVHKQIPHEYLIDIDTHSRSISTLSEINVQLFVDES